MRGLTVEEESVLRSCASPEDHFDPCPDRETHERLRDRGLVSLTEVEVVDADGGRWFYRYDVTDLGRLALRTAGR